LPSRATRARSRSNSLGRRASGRPARCATRSAVTSSRSPKRSTSGGARRRSASQRARPDARAQAGSVVERNYHADAFTSRIVRRFGSAASHPSLSLRTSEPADPRIPAERREVGIGDGWLHARGALRCAPRARSSNLPSVIPAAWIPGVDVAPGWRPLVSEQAGTGGDRVAHHDHRESEQQFS